MTILKLCFIFSHLMFYCYLFFKIARLNVLFLLRNSVLCIWLSNEGITHQFNLSLNYLKLNFFLRNEHITFQKCFKKVNSLNMDHRVI